MKTFNAILAINLIVFIAALVLVPEQLDGTWFLAIWGFSNMFGIIWLTIVLALWNNRTEPKEYADRWPEY